MKQTVVHVERREHTGKQAARKLRAAGRAPGVLYGQGIGAIPIALDPRELERSLRASGAGLNTLLDLRSPSDSQLDGQLALVKELQHDPVRGEILHVDLYRVDLERTVELSVPIRLVGKARGVEQGGMLDHTLREVELECLPRAIPEEIEVDVSELDIGDVLHVRDLPLPEGVKLRTDPDISVVHVMAAAAEEEVVEEEAEVAAAGPEETAPAPGASAEGEGE